jgi:O-antigen/teichoic acid export membrane protein
MSAAKTTTMDGSPALEPTRPSQVKRGTRGHLFHGAATLSIGQVACQVMALARNAIAARLVSETDFGVAMTFGVMVSFMEMVSDLGIDRLLVQSPRGEDPRWQGTIQLVSAVRGAVLALLLLALAGPFARLFGVPEAAWAFRCLSLMPLFGGLAHLDRVRFQRSMRFRPHVLVEVIADGAALIAAWPLCAWLRDYSALLYLMLGRALVSWLAGHVIAQRRYSLAWDRDAAAEVRRFGWPLTMNGALLFGILQGDRAILGAAYSKPALALYGAAGNLAAIPTRLCAGLGGRAILPVLSRRDSTASAFAGAYRTTIQLYALGASVVTIPLIVIGDGLTNAVYGAKFTGAGAFIGFLAGAAGLQMIRAAVTLAAIARGDTRTSLIANCFRVLGLGGALWVAMHGGALSSIAAAGLAGEAVALLASAVRMRRTHGLPVAATLWPAVVACAGPAAAVTVSTTGASVGTLASGLLTSAGLASCQVGLALAAHREARSEAARALRWVRRRLFTSEPEVGGA